MSRELPDLLPHWNRRQDSEKGRRGEASHKVAADTGVPDGRDAQTQNHTRAISARERLLIRYFRKAPSPPDHKEDLRRIAIGAGIASVGVLFGLALGSSGCITVIAALVGGGALGGKGITQILRNRYEYRKSMVRLFPQASEGQVKEWHSRAVERLRAHSLEAVDLTPEHCQLAGHDPIVAPVLWYVHGVAPEDLVWRVGQDGSPWFGVYRISFFWLAEDHLAIFACDYNFIRDAVLNEETLEFFYRDIISVSIHKLSSALTLASGESLTTRQELRISVSNDRYFTMTVGSEELRELTGAEEPPESGTEKAVRALRTKLRAKKAQPSVH